MAERGHAQHDACAVMWLVAPELFTSRDAHAAVELGTGLARGRTVVDRWGVTGQVANVGVFETLGAEGFFRLLRERIGALP